MLVVTGATGALGRATVSNLLKRVDATRIGVSVRDPDKAKDLAAAGIRVRHGDFAKPETLASAFEGAHTVMIVSVMAAGEVAMRQHRAAIDAAKAAGVQRIVYTSQMGANPSSPFPPMPDHAATEEALRASGVAFTSLRNGFYAASARALFGHAMQTGELVAPADGPVAWTAHDDLAEAAAIAMTTDELDGVTPPLTAREAIDLERVAAIMSARRIVISDDEYAAGLRTRGMPEHAVRLMLGMFAAMRLGQFAMTDPTLARVIDHEPRTFGDFMASAT